MARLGARLAALLPLFLFPLKFFSFRCRRAVSLVGLSRVTKLSSAATAVLPLFLLASTHCGGSPRVFPFSLFSFHREAWMACAQWMLLRRSSTDNIAKILRTRGRCRRLWPLYVVVATCCVRCPGRFGKTKSIVATRILA